MLRRFELGDKLNYFQLIDLHPRSGAELVNGRVSSSNSRIVSSAYSEGWSGTHLIISFCELVGRSSCRSPVLSQGCCDWHVGRARCAGREGVRVAARRCTRSREPRGRAEDACVCYGSALGTGGGGSASGVRAACGARADGAARLRGCAEQRARSRSIRCPWKFQQSYCQPVAARRCSAKAAVHWHTIRSEFTAQ